VAVAGLDVIADEAVRLTPCPDQLASASLFKAKDPVGLAPTAVPPSLPNVISYIVTRERRVAVNEMLVRAGDQTW
jgi:hypothetical protein